MFRLVNTISVLGSGWLGLPLAERLVNDGFQVRASSTTASNAEAIEAIGVASFIFNINKITDISRNFLESEILIVNIPSRDVESFRDLVEEIELSPVRRILYVSSTSVYTNTGGVVTEADGAERPTSPFFIIENLFRASQRFRTTVIRFGGLIGPGRHPGRFFGKGRPVSNPDAPVNLVHLDDCIGMICKVLEKNAWGEVFNGCADTHPARREFYSRAAAALGLTEPVFGDNKTGDFKIVSNEKARNALGYEFRRPNLMAIDFGSAF